MTQNEEKLLRDTLDRVTSILYASMNEDQLVAALDLIDDDYTRLKSSYKAKRYAVDELDTLGKALLPKPNNSQP